MGIISARVAGALAGQAVGDALGAPANGLSAYDVTRRFQKIDDYFGKTGSFSSATRAGFMILSAFHSGGPTEESSVRAHEKLQARNVPERWTKTLDSDDPMMERGSPESLGAELAAKLCPLGAWAAATDKTDKELLVACKVAALPTHAFRPAILSAWVAAKVVKETVRNHDAYSRPSDLYDKEGSLLHQLIGFCREVEEKIPERTDDPMSERLAYARARLQGKCRVTEFAALNGHSRDVVELVSFCVFCFMNRPEDFGAVTEAIGLGGAASIRGAVLGAMIGAFAGVREIPPALVRDVEGSNRVLAMARGLTDEAD